MKTLDRALLRAELTHLRQEILNLRHLLKDMAEVIALQHTAARIDQLPAEIEERRRCGPQSPPPSKTTTAPAVGDCLFESQVVYDYDPPLYCGK